MNPFPVKDGQTITFCSGEYSGTLGIDGAHNVTITGVVDPMLGPPRIIPASLAGSLGSVLPDIVSVKNSNNVTISNLSLDGAPKGSTTADWNPALTDVNGIHVVNSSVTITDNAISRIHPQTPKTQGGTGIPQQHDFRQHRARLRSARCGDSDLRPGPGPLQDQEQQVRLRDRGAKSGGTREDDRGVGRKIARTMR